MTDSEANGSGALGRLGIEDDAGVLTMSHVLGAPRAEVWAALTETARLGDWLGDLEGDLQEGGAFRARFHASGWEGEGRVEVCEPLHRIEVVTWSEGGPEDAVTLELADVGGGTQVTVECRGLPVDQLAAYGAGNQIHLEDLASYVVGGGRCDARTRFGELYPEYQRRAEQAT